MDWVVNYNGRLVDFKNLNSGSLITYGKVANFFLKLKDNEWKIIVIPEAYDPDNVRKLNLVSTKANSTKINKYYMELLEKEFPGRSYIGTDLEVYNLINTDASGFYGDGDKLKDKYISDYNAIIADNRWYEAGEIVYYKNQKYVVKADKNGEGYLELAIDSKGVGYEAKNGNREVVEEVHYIDYFSQNGVLKPLHSSIYADYINGNGSYGENELIVDYPTVIERRLKASKISEIRYWECFYFKPGYSTKVMPDQGQLITLKEGILTSKGETASKPSTDYGDWEVKVGGVRSIGDTHPVNNVWKCLKDTHIFRPTVGDDLIWYRQKDNGFEEVIVSQYFGQGTNYRKVKSILQQHGGKFLTDGFFNDLKQEFLSNYSFITFEQFVNKFKGENWIRPPKDWSNTPHIRPGSGTKELLFSSFQTKSSSFKVDIVYSTFLRYQGNKDTMSRGKAKLQLVKYNGNSYEIIDTLFSVDYNVGNYWDSNTYKKIVKNYQDMEIGKYGFRLELADTYQDTKQIMVRALPKITQFTSSSIKKYDNSTFTFYIIDKETGKKISIDGKDTIVLKGSEIRKCYRIVVPKGKEYIVKGQLVRDTASEGGLTGNGGAVRLDEGVIKYDVIERDFPLVQSSEGGIVSLFPVPGWDISIPSTEETGGDDGDSTDPFCWLDVIEILGHPNPPLTDEERKNLMDKASCYPLGTNVELNVNNLEETSQLWQEFMNINNFNSMFEDDIAIILSNPLDVPVDVTLDFTMIDNEECGGGGFINYFGGGFEYWNRGKLIGDGVKNIPSGVKVVLQEYIADHEIIGGCNGSYAEILIKSGDTVLKVVRVDEEGWTEFNTDELYDYNTDEFDIEIKTYQNGYEDPRGFDVRSTFILKTFDLFTSYELNASNFNSVLEFYINNEKKLSIDEVGEDVHYFPVKQGLNKYKFIFSTNSWDYNWDYVEIPWIRLTNWICDDVTVVPYCEPGGGDKCIEALIGCVLGLLPKPKPKGCVIIKYINYDTNKVMKQIKYEGYSEGDYTFNAVEFPDFKIIGDSSKNVHIDESGTCSTAEFYYKRLYRDCVYVIHIDKVTESVILKEEYYDLFPGEYTFTAKTFTGYKLISESSQNISIDYLETVPEDCKLIIFEYEREIVPHPYLDCVQVIYREKDNLNNILATEHYYDLEPGEYKYNARDFDGYKVVGDVSKEVIIEEITEPVTDCKTVIFEYRKIELGCVIVSFKDKVNNVVIDTDYYYNLFPGEYNYNAKEFEGYKLVDDRVKTILLSEEDEQCLEVIFLYEPLIEGCAIGKKIWLFT